MLLLEFFHIPDGKDGDQVTDDAHDQHHDEGKVVNGKVRLYGNGMAGPLLKPQDGPQLHHFQQGDPKPFELHQCKIENGNGSQDVHGHYGSGSYETGKGFKYRTAKPFCRYRHRQRHGSGGRYFHDPVPGAVATYAEYQRGSHQRDTDQQGKQIHKQPLFLN